MYLHSYMVMDYCTLVALFLQYRTQNFRVTHLLRRPCVNVTDSRRFRQQQLIPYILTHMYATMYTVSQKNNTDVAHYNFDAHQPILVIFGRHVGETVCYQMVVCYLTSPNCSIWGNMNMNPGNCGFSFKSLGKIDKDNSDRLAFINSFVPVMYHIY